MRKGERWEMEWCEGGVLEEQEEVPYEGDAMVEGRGWRCMFTEDDCGFSDVCE